MADKTDFQCPGLTPCYANPVDNDYSRLVELYKAYWQKNKCDRLHTDRECDIAYYEEVLRDVRKKYLSIYELDISPAVNSDRLKELKSAIKLYKIRLRRYQSESEYDGNEEKNISFDEKVHEIKKKRKEDEEDKRYEPVLVKNIKGTCIKGFLVLIIK